MALGGGDSDERIEKDEKRGGTCTAVGLWRRTSNGRDVILRAGWGQVLCPLETRLAEKDKSRKPTTTSECHATASVRRPTCASDNDVQHANC